MKLLSVLVIVFSFVSIGCNVELKDKKEDTSLSYNFDENGCKTGVHSFGSKAEYCAGLKDDVLNNGCAYSTRKAEYEANCGTDWAFWQPTTTETASK